LIVQFYFWNYIFQKLVSHSSSVEDYKQNDLTILICAKNEENNLKHLIPDLIQQGGQAQILVVDDFSEDNTLSILSAYANDYPKLKYFSASKNIKGKKQALMEGLAKVDTKWVLLTDADCRPSSFQWSRKMLAAAQNKDLVLGFSPYKKSNGFLNRWIRYEAVLTAIQYFSYSLSGNTYMGVGRNLLYAKNAVGSGGQLLANIDLHSGDDDLLVNAIANEENVAIQLDPESWVYSEPQKKWSAYFNQKRRHMSTASRYKLSHQILLVLFSVSWILFYVSIAFLILTGNYVFALILFVQKETW